MKKLGNTEDQRVLSPLRTEGKTLRECRDILGWTYGRVSEADRALRGMPSDSRTGRSLRGRNAVAKAQTTANLKAQLEAYRARIAS